MIEPRITVTIVFHQEGALAIPALASMRDMVNAVEAAGSSIEARAVLDSADELTRGIVEERGEWLTGITEVSFGDLGLARNAGVVAANGEFLAFLDGDDLWGDLWLTRALEATSLHQDGHQVIWHPEAVYYFYENDFDRHAMSESPDSRAQSFFMYHSPSEGPEFDRDMLFFNNVWCANVFAHRSIHERFPYRPVNRTRGLGVEDWSWNFDTIWAGVPHRVVSNTIHIVRVKETGSLGQQNVAKGFLPYIPDEAAPALGPYRHTVKASEFSARVPK